MEIEHSNDPYIQKETNAFTVFVVVAMYLDLENEYEPKRVSSFFFGRCAECGKERISVGWCNDCEINSFKLDFVNWTSGNLNIDDYIKYTQLNASGSVDYLEYINFEQLDLIENTNKGGDFSTIYSALWLEGPRWIWDEEAEQWTHHTSNYMFVMRYYDSEDLYSYLDKRPVASQLYELLGNWVTAICDDPDSSDLFDQFELAEEKKISYIKKYKYQEIHSQAVYKSKHLYFSELNYSNEY
ncbi:10160_t:CDS:2 [Funneliformis caledonium]|uniref:10160_t:CDS:1 n=1 Tax=Funneliformis caledonium TaxID=1117310 RepID=A0A9N9HDK2_9GLOM|nr:10160_t:CDS:2 [Funneliformis caledonium]